MYVLYTKNDNVTYIKVFVFVVVNTVDSGVYMSCRERGYMNKTYMNIMQQVPLHISHL